MLQSETSNLTDVLRGLGIALYLHFSRSGILSFSVIPEKSRCLSQNRLRCYKNLRRKLSTICRCTFCLYKQQDS